MEIIEKILRGIREKTFLFKGINYGIKPIEIKDTIIKTFNKYFDNKNILEKYSIEILVPTFVSYLKIKQNNQTMEIFDSYYDIFKKAKKIDDKCFESFSFWYPEIVASISKFWSIFGLEIDKNMLEDEDKIFECFRNIGDIIEGLSKPYLKNLLCQIKIIDKITPDFQKINNLDLGDILSELIKKTDFIELFAPSPWKIRINQWRNIAYHHNYKITNDNIFCWYGKGINKKEAVFHKNEIIKIAEVIFNCFGLQKLAFDIFFIDNSELIRKYLPNVDYEMRFEAMFMIIAAGIASQGFEILKIEKNPDKAKLIIKDLTNMGLIERSIHASQFLYPLWLMTKAKELTVEYRDSNGIPKLLFHINSKYCEMVNKSELEFHDIARKMEIVNLEDESEK